MKEIDEIEKRAIQAELDPNEPINLVSSLLFHFPSKNFFIFQLTDANNECEYVCSKLKAREELGKHLTRNDEVLVSFHL